MKMSMAVVPVMIVAHSMGPPIRMSAYPHMNVTQPDWVTDQPDIARTQIVILVTHETDVFVTIPIVIVRDNRHFHRRRGHNHPDTHPPIRLDHTT